MAERVAITFAAIVVLLLAPQGAGPTRPPWVFMTGNVPCKRSQRHRIALLQGLETFRPGLAIGLIWCPSVL
jgi:hypothetical protein